MAVTGWGEQGWSDDGFGGLISANVNVSGVSGSGELGEETPKTVKIVIPTGVSAEGLVGIEDPDTNAEWGIGEWNQSQLGWGGANLDVEAFASGVEASGLLGDEEAPQGDANVNVTAVTGVGEIDAGSVVQIQQNLNVTGLEATGTAGTASSGIFVDVSLTGVEGTGEEGTVTEFTGDANVSPTGVSADAVTNTGGVLAFGANGDAQISTAQSKFGGASLLLDGTGDSVESGGAYNFGGGPFTVEMWVRPTNDTQDRIFFDGRDSTSNNAIALRQAGDNLIVIRANLLIFNINAVFSADTWTHIAVTRGDPFGNTLSVFINGIKENSSLAGFTATSANLHIGSDYNSANNWAGYIDELRVSSVDRYDGTDFTPATEAFSADVNTPVLLHFDGDNGSTVFTNDGLNEDGSVTVTGTANFSVTGVTGTMALGDETPRLSVEVDVTGVEAGDTAVGSVVVAINISPVLTGVSATAIIDSPLIWGEITTTQTPNWVEVDTNAA